MDTRSERENAWKLHQEGKLAEAEKAYRALLETIPEEWDVGNLGALLRSQGRLKESISLYRTWINKFPNQRHY